MDIVPVVGIMSAAAIVATIWRVGHRVSLRDLMIVARATRSPRACIGFILFCR
jgi:hypothetical protein